MDLKKQTYLLLLVFMLLPILFACQEVYDPGDIDSEKKIPVIIGQITNNAGPHTVSVFWAMAYNSDIRLPITTASIFIYDNSRNYAILENNGNGIYQTKPGEFEGVVGREYWAIVRLEDGTVFKSVPTIMPPGPKIEGLCAEIGVLNRPRVNDYGDVTVKQDPGLFVYADLCSIPEDSKYFRFDGRYVAQNQFFPNPLSNVGIHCWRNNYLVDIPIVKKSIASTGAPIIKNVELGFLPYVLADEEGRDEFMESLLVNSSDSLGEDTVPPDGMDENQEGEYVDAHAYGDPYGWIVAAEVYSTSREAYVFYEAISKQLNAENRMFDPIASQIPGNFFCMMDTNTLVFGLFEVASKATFHSGFYWHKYQDDYFAVELENYLPPLGMGCLAWSIPDFWVNFKYLKFNGK